MCLESICRSTAPVSILGDFKINNFCFQTGTDRLCHYGGIEVLFDVIRGTNQACTDIALSIVGNVSMDAKVQSKVSLLHCTFICIPADGV